MKKYINKLLFLVLILSAASCSEDYLSEDPTNAYTPASALSTPENMVYICIDCNLKKRDMSLLQFIKKYGLERELIEMRLDELEKTY